MDSSVEYRIQKDRLPPPVVDLRNYAVPGTSTLVMPTTRATTNGHQKAYSFDSRWGSKTKTSLDATHPEAGTFGSRATARKDDPEKVPPRYPPHKTTAQGFPVNNKLKKAKYATSVDDRGFLSGKTLARVLQNSNLS